MSFRPTHYGPGGRRPKRRFAHLRGSCLGTNSGCRGQLIMPRWPSGDGKRRSASQAI